MEAFDGDAHGKIGREGGDLTFGADSGVGAAGAEDVKGLANGATDGGFEHALGRAEWFVGVFGFLFLPAVEVVAVVGDDEFEASCFLCVGFGRRIGNLAQIKWIRGFMLVHGGSWSSVRSDRRGIWDSSSLLVERSIVC